MDFFCGALTRSFEVGACAAFWLPVTEGAGLRACTSADLSGTTLTFLVCCCLVLAAAVQHSPASSKGQARAERSSRHDHCEVLPRPASARTCNIRLCHLPAAIYAGEYQLSTSCLAESAVCTHSCEQLAEHPHALSAARQRHQPAHCRYQCRLPHVNSA